MSTTTQYKHYHTQAAAIYLSTDGFLKKKTSTASTKIPKIMAKIQIDSKRDDISEFDLLNEVPVSQNSQISNVKAKNTSSSNSSHIPTRNERKVKKKINTPTEILRPPDSEFHKQRLNTLVTSMIKYKRNDEIAINDKPSYTKQDRSRRSFIKLKKLSTGNINNRKNSPDHIRNNHLSGNLSKHIEESYMDKKHITSTSKTVDGRRPPTIKPQTNTKSQLNNKLEDQLKELEIQLNSLPNTQGEDSPTINHRISPEVPNPVDYFTPSSGNLHRISPDVSKSDIADENLIKRCNSKIKNHVKNKTKIKAKLKEEEEVKKFPQNTHIIVTHKTPILPTIGNSERVIKEKGEKHKKYKTEIDYMKATKIYGGYGETNAKRGEEAKTNKSIILKPLTSQDRGVIGIYPKNINSNNNTKYDPIKSTKINSAKLTAKHEIEEILQQKSRISGRENKEIYYQKNIVKPRCESEISPTTEQDNIAPNIIFRKKMRSKLMGRGYVNSVIGRPRQMNIPGVSPFNSNLPASTPDIDSMQRSSFLHRNRHLKSVVSRNINKINSEQKSVYAIPWVSETNSQLQHKSFPTNNLDRFNNLQFNGISPTFRINVPKLKIEEFIIKQTIGVGCFGKVKLALWEKFDKWIAIKVQPKDYLLKMRLKTQVMREKEILYKYNNCYIPELYGTIQDKDNLYLVMEFISGGGLAPIIRKKLKYNFKAMEFYSAEIICALEYLHNNSVIFRDLKMENIMISEGGHVKLVDFGFAKEMQTDRTKSILGTPGYISPEQMLKQSYGLEVDIWAFGVIIFELITGFNPFYDPDPMKMKHNIMISSIKWPPHIDVHWKNLITNILVKDPEGRFIIQQIKSHRIYQNIIWDLFECQQGQPPYVPETKLEFDIMDFREYPASDEILRLQMERLNNHEHLFTSSVSATESDPFVDF